MKILKLLRFIKFFFLTFIFCFFGFGGILVHIKNILNLPSYIFVILLFISVLIGIFVAIIFNNRTKRTGKLIVFIDNHILDFLIAVLFICGLSISIHGDVRFLKEEVLSILGICWAIFAISILILTLSMPLISKMVETKSASFSGQNFSENNAIGIVDAKQKLMNYRRVAYGSFPVTMVLINLILLILTCYFCILVEYSIFSENLLFICVLSTLFTILEIFSIYTYDIFKNRKDIMKANKLSEKDHKNLKRREEIFNFCDKFKKLDKEIPLKSRNIEYKKLNKLFRNLSDHLNNMYEEKYLDNHFIELDNLVSKIEKLLNEYKIKL